MCKLDFWFYKPELHWFGWETLIPMYFGDDEYQRRTIVFGWTITGRIVIAHGEKVHTEHSREIEEIEREEKENV